MIAMVISVILIIVNLMFAVGCAFIFRARGGAVRARTACSFIHLAVFNIIAVSALEIFKYGYMTNEFTADEIVPTVFSNSHLIAVSFSAIVSAAALFICVFGSRTGRVISFFAMLGASIVCAVAGCFIIGGIESSVQALGGEYTSAVIPVIIGTALVSVLCAANLLLVTESKWQRIVLAVVNLIDVAVFVTVFVLMLGWVKELSDGSSGAVYAAALFGIIIILPSIISMCSVFAERTDTASLKKVKK